MRPHSSGRNRRRKCLAHIVALPICWLALHLAAPSEPLKAVFFPVVAGGLVVLALSVLRHTRRHASAALLALAASLGGIGLIAIEVGLPPDWAALWGESTDPVLEALLANTPALGYGLGALPSALDMVAGSQQSWHPTPIMRLVLEMGYAGAALTLGVLVIGSMKLFLASAARDQDWQFAAQGAALVASVLVAAAYTRVSFAFPHFMMVALILSIALAQARGRGKEISI